jgi:hypothetical protein
VTNPSTPLYVAGTSYLLVGGLSGTTGTLFKLDTSNGATATTLGLVANVAVGSPARDSANEVFHVGSTAGVVYAATLP